MEQFSVAENKGKYCKFVKAANGDYILQPVTVPAYVKEERARQKRQQEINRHVEKNRRRAQAISAGSVVFMSVALGVFAIVCCFFLGVQNRVNTRLSDIASLQTQIEQMSQDNDITEKRMIRAENINEIETEARERLGMETVKPDQIVYYTSEAADYMLQYSDVEE